MKYVVTGGNGFLGRHVNTELEHAGHEVISLDLRSGSDERHIAVDLGSVTLKHLGDLIPEVDWIIHLASVVNFTPTFDRKLFEANVLGTLKIAELAREKNAKVIFISSVAVHPSGDTSLGASSPINPSQPYGLSKWLGEQILESLGVPAVVVRLAGIIGAYGPAHLRLNTAIRDAALNGTVPTITGKGNGRRNYIYVRDAARAIRTISEESIGGLHYYGGPEPITIAEMATQICSTFLGGADPHFSNGAEAPDQLVEVSRQLPGPRSFRLALEDMQREYNANRVSF